MDQRKGQPWLGNASQDPEIDNCPTSRKLTRRSLYSCSKTTQQLVAMWVAIQASPNLRVRLMGRQSRSRTDCPLRTIRRMNPEGLLLFMVKSFVQLLHAVLGKAWADVSAAASLLRCMHILCLTNCCLSLLLHTVIRTK